MPGHTQLSDREQLFVREYLVDLNGSAAAVRAGYAPSSAKQAAYKLMRRPHVKAAVDAAMAARSRRLEITADRVLGELALLGFANVMDYFAPQPDGALRLDLSRLTRDRAAAIVDFTVEEFVAGRGAAGREVRRMKLKLADKSRNLELIGKHLGMFARGAERTAQEEETGGDVRLSDLELAQRILGLLARGGQDGVDEAGA
jgi:phage terminase small subunit